jgi:hypothetical protein
MYLRLLKDIFQLLRNEISLLKKLSAPLESRYVFLGCDKCQKFDLMSVS